jgi:hypothetical protein
LDLLRHMASFFPTSVAIRDDDDFTPMDLLRHSKDYTEEAETLLDEYYDSVADAVLGCVLSGKIPSLDELLKQAKVVANNRGLSDQHAPDDNSACLCCLKLRILHHESAQAILKDENYQELILGMIAMNKAGRDYVEKDPGNKLKGCLVLEAIADDLDCLFLHLRESPSLCHRE